MIEETPEQGEKKMVLMNFWSNLLQLEKEIEKPSVSLQKVQELIQLYKLAIEFYDDQSNQVELQKYKKKLSLMHKRGNII